MDKDPDSTREVQEKSAVHIADTEKELGSIRAGGECRQAGLEGEHGAVRRASFAVARKVLAPGENSEASPTAADAEEPLVSAEGMEWEALGGAMWKSVATDAALVRVGAGCLAQAG